MCFKIKKLIVLNKASENYLIQHNKKINQSMYRHLLDTSSEKILEGRKHCNSICINRNNIETSTKLTSKTKMC